MSKILPFLVLIAAMIPIQMMGQSVPQIIFDTDMGPDYDDVGALAVLHALAAQGECDILATVASDGHPSIAPTIEVLNRYFEKPDIPIGSPSRNAPAFTAENSWNDSLIHRYLPQVKTNSEYPQAVKVYRKILAESADTSVTIVTVGFVTNLADLLRSGPDEFSLLSGKELIRKKVKNYVAMAGVFPEGKEFNVYQDSVSSNVVFSQWPTPILFSGFEIGARIGTGRHTAHMNVRNSPVQWAYKYNLETFGGGKALSRPSWDHTAVLVAVRPAGDYFYVNGPGRFIINPDGTNSWDPATDAGHHFLTHKYPYRIVAELLEGLMMYTP